MENSSLFLDILFHLLLNCLIIINCTIFPSSIAKRHQNEKPLNLVFAMFFTSLHINTLSSYEHNVISISIKYLCKLKATGINTRFSNEFMC